MVIEMIARKIGEGACAQAHTIEPVLIKAVGGRLHGQMGDVIAREPVEGFMQGHGVRRGERAIGFALGRDDARRAKGGGAQSKLRPDLSCESRNGCLAAGTGDGGDGGGLRWVKTRGGCGESGAHIRRHDQRRARQRLFGRAFGDDRDGACMDGALGEAQAIGAHAGGGEKDKAGLHGATVRRQARHLARRRIGGRLRVRKKLAQADHQFPLDGVLT